MRALAPGASKKWSTRISCRFWGGCCWLLLLLLLLGLQPSSSVSLLQVLAPVHSSTSGRGAVGGHQSIGRQSQSFSLSNPHDTHHSSPVNQSLHASQTHRPPPLGARRPRCGSRTRRAAWCRSAGRRSPGTAPRRRPASSSPPVPCRTRTRRGVCIYMWDESGENKGGGGGGR